MDGGFEDTTLIGNDLIEKAIHEFYLEQCLQHTVNEGGKAACLWSFFFFFYAGKGHHHGMAV